MDDRRAAPLALGRAPADGGGQQRRLAAGEIVAAAVEEHLDRLPRRQELELAEEGEPVDPLGAADARDALAELDADTVRRAVARVLENEKQQSAVEDDVEDHVGVATLVHRASVELLTRADFCDLP